jgi:molybdopterin converting factor small subunit
MRVKVQLFGHLARKIGRELELDLGEDTTLASAVRSISEKCGMGVLDLRTEGGSRGAFVIMLNGRVEQPSTLLKDGDVIAFYPPVTGG